MSVVLTIPYRFWSGPVFSLSYGPDDTGFLTETGVFRAHEAAIAVLRIGSTYSDE